MFVPFLIMGSFGVASSPSVRALLLWRFVQAVGAGTGLSVAAGVIGDMYKLEERGAALGVFFAVSNNFGSCSRSRELVGCPIVP